MSTIEITKEIFNQYLHKLQAGEKQAIVFFYNNFYTRMVTIGKKFVSPIDAEDIASNIIFDLLRNSQNYTDVDIPAAWIYKAVKNRALNIIKQNKKTVLTEFIDCFEARNETAVTVENQVSAKIELEQLLNSLSEENHEIAVYHFVFGYKYREISKMMNIPKGTIKRRIFDIRKKQKNNK